MNPYYRIALAAIAATYITPKIINKFVRVEVTGTDTAVNDVTSGLITGVTTAAIFVGLRMIFTGKGE